MKNRRIISILFLLVCAAFFAYIGSAFSLPALAAETAYLSTGKEEAYTPQGGGYAASGQMEGVGYTSELYDATNSLPTSDAMFLMGADDGHMWIGGYSGVIRYDGSVFERLDTSNGLTSARVFYEDSLGRIWVGTNDNGVVVLDGKERIHLTYKEGLPSSSIRAFAEDGKGNVFIGTTAGVCYADTQLNVGKVKGEEFPDDRILRLDADSSGRIYGHASSGIVFRIEDCRVKESFSGEELGMEMITTIMADPKKPGSLYIGTEGNTLYHGRFGDPADDLEKTDLGSLQVVHWLNYDCGRVWVSSAQEAGYLDENSEFHLLRDIPIHSGIEMITSDYQGNLWIASSTQGVLKVVTSNFLDVTNAAGMENDVANAACLYDGKLYIGMDNGLHIIDRDGNEIRNRITRYIGKARIRCIKADEQGNLWFAAYTEDRGLVCLAKDGSIRSYTKEDGMPDNQIRCICIGTDRRVIVGTNGGIVILKDGRIIRTVGVAEGIRNTVILTVCETNEGEIMAGSDGDGIYIIDQDKVNRLGREDGLTSDVVLKIIKDDARGVLWLVTSNSIEYLKNGRITQVTSFPYNNNYDIYFDDGGTAWILSSYGIYNVSAEEMLEDTISDYKLYTIENGLPFSVTTNSFSAQDEEGNLYIPGREGVIRVNINDFFDEQEQVLVDVASVFCDDQRVYADEGGVYRIPASSGRVRISAAVMDYSLINPTVRLFLEGGPDEGITVPRSKLSALEYTNLHYGEYPLHIQIVNDTTGELLQDSVFALYKEARISELLIVRVFFMLLLAFLTGLIVWRFMHTTIIARQYEEIRQARDEAESANSAKSRFLANMSHEIRTPINTIMGMNEMVIREDAAGVPKEYHTSMMNYASDIRNASESLLGLINDLLDISKIESGKMHLVEQEYEVMDMLRSIVSMIRVRSTQKELTFDVSIDDILPKRMYGDVAKIKQILLNLLTNAVKYTDAGGFLLSVSMDERIGDEARLRFSVKDTGMGVRPEELEKLFTAYERLDEEKNSSIQGTGLGLNISKKFAELMHGTLICESKYGQGSEFILSITQRIVDAAPVGAFTERDESGDKGPYVPQFIAPDADILVVDDNPMNLNVIKGLLKATRVFVTTSSSGEDALDKIRDTRFNVVLLDHMMPGMDGVETVARIREFDKELPVYALTANSTAGEEFYISKGFNGYLSKPVESEVLERTIKQHLPKEMMEEPTQADAVEELSEIPEEMSWIYETEGISVQEGIKNSGGISGFLASLELFWDTIDDSARVIKDAYDSDNIRFYTIKVHALKSSARIIGAMELSALCESLEDAGNRLDRSFIRENTDRLLTDYRAYTDRLSRLREVDEGDGNREPIPEEELKDAYSALAEVIPMMDYDSVEMILEQLKDFALPDEDAARMKKIQKLLKTCAWEELEDLIKEVYSGV